MSAGAEQGEVIEAAKEIEPVGATLAAARRERGIELDAVSHELNISKRFLAALESDDFDALPGSTYVIGFVRSYGEYLGLDAEKLARAVKRHCRPEPVMPPSYSPQPADEARRPAMSIVMITGFAFAGILVGWKIITSGAEEAAITPSAAAAIGEYANDRESPVAAAKAAERTMAENETTPNNPAPAETQVVESKYAAVEPADTSQEPAAAQSEDATLVALAEQEPQAAAPADQAVSTPEVALAGGDETMGATETETSRATGLSAAEDVEETLTRSVAASEPASGVQILGKRDTWVLITDANEETLFNGVIRAGETFRPPQREGLTLTTGDATGLTVTINSRKFDLPGDPATSIVEIKLNPQELVAFSRAGGGP